MGFLSGLAWTVRECLVWVWNCIRDNPLLLGTLGTWALVLATWCMARRQRLANSAYLLPVRLRTEGGYWIVEVANYGVAPAYSVVISVCARKRQGRPVWYYAAISGPLKLAAGENREVRFDGRSICPILPLIIQWASLDRSVGRTWWQFPAEGSENWFNPVRPLPFLMWLRLALSNLQQLMRIRKRGAAGD